MRRHSARFALLAAGAAIAIVGGVAMVATAADVPGAITRISISLPDGTPITGRVGNDSAIRVSADWAVPTSAKPGDTFGLGLPAEFSATATPVSFDLAASDGESAGTCELVARRLSCTLSQYVTDHVDVHGTLWIIQTLETATTDHDVTVDLVFDVDGSTARVPVEIGAPTDPDTSDAAKFSGWREGVTSWEIYLPDTIYADLPITIADQPGPGQECTDPADPEVRLTGRNADGSFGEVVRGIVPESDGDGGFTMTIDGPALDRYPLYTLYYECAITDADQQTYTNTAEISAAHTETIPVTSQVWALEGGGQAEGTPVEVLATPTSPAPTAAAPTSSAPTSAAPTSPAPTLGATPPAATPSTGTSAPSVAGPAAPAPSTGSTPSASTTVTLPKTGGSPMPTVMLAVGALLTGAGIIVARRRDSVR